MCVRVRLGREDTGWALCGSPAASLVWSRLCRFCSPTSRSSAENLVVAPPRPSRTQRGRCAAHQRLWSPHTPEVWLKDGELEGESTCDRTTDPTGSLGKEAPADLPGAAQAGRELQVRCVFLPAFLEPGAWAQSLYTKSRQFRSPLEGTASFPPESAPVFTGGSCAGLVVSPPAPSVPLVPSDPTSGWPEEAGAAREQGLGRLPCRAPIPQT